MNNHRIYSMAFADVYPHYVAKAERKDRTKAEVDEIISWPTDYDKSSLSKQIKNRVTFEEFFKQAPKMNPARNQITGVICGVRVEEIEDPLMQEIRYLDKLIEDLAKGKPLERILNCSFSA